MRNLIISALSFVFCLSLPPHASAWLHWQPPDIQSHGQGLKLLLKAQPAEPQNSQIRSGTAPESQITITARPGQVFTVCSQQLKAEANSVLLTAYDQTKKTPHQLLLTHGQTTLYLEKTYICPTEDIQQQPYNYEGILYSQEPFLVTRQNDPKKKEQDKNTLIPPIGLPSTLSSQNLPTGGIGPDSDEDSFFKYPFRPPFVDQSGITMVLLPFIKLPPDWQHQIPGSQWYHWLMCEPDYDSGAILNIQVNGESVARLPIHSWELKELAEDLTNSRQLLQKLAYRLNGRETFIQQLLDILATAEQNPMNEESRVRIEKQLADVLAQSDHSFSLELEWFSLQAAMTPDHSIITEHNGKGKKQEANSGEAPGSNDQNQHGAPSSHSVPVSHDPEQGIIRFSDDNGKNEHQGRVGAAEQSGNHEDHGEQSQDSSGAQQNNPSDQDGTEPDALNNGSPPASETTDAAGSPEPVTITFIGQTNAGKSSLANRLLQINHFAAQLTHVSVHEADFVLPNIKIRALPGYGRPSLSANSFLELENFPIKNNEVVIMVMANEMSLEDEVVLQNLLNHGHPPERVLLVYNKFDAILDGVVGRQQIETDSSRYALENSIKKELMNRQLKILEEWQPELVTDESSDHLTQSLQVLANRLKAQKEQDKPFLLFTSASDVSTYSLEQDEELIKAISNALSGQEKKTFKEQFLDIRPGKVKKFSDFISHRFSAVIEDAKAGGVAAEDVFGSLFRQLNNDFGLHPEKGCNHWLREFSKIYKTDFNEKIKEIVNGDDSRLHTLQKQFIAFYTGHILGSIWYKFIGERRQEKEIDELGQTALHRWARNGNSGWVWLWLQLHSKKALTLLNKRDINERTPLHLAAYSGNEDTVRYILEHGPNVDAKDSVDYTPLHWAAFFGQETITEQLLRHNASLTGQHRLRVTPLHLAAWSNQGAMVNKLLEWGANIHSSAYGTFPIHCAAATGSLNSLEALLAHRPIDLNILFSSVISSGHTAQHIAAWYGHKEFVARLINAGANQKQLTTDGYMAGDLAKFRGHEHLGLSVSEKNVDQQMPKAPYTIDLEIPIANNLESMHIDQYGYSTLHRAAREGNVNRVRDILNNNECMNITTVMSGYTPLHIAALYGHIKIAALLLSPANREDKTVSGNTPLYLAALFNREKMIEFLLDHSCRPYATNHSGIAVLHVASAMGSRNTLERIFFDSLKQRKGDCNPTSNGLTAMHFAARYGNIEAIKFLNQVAGISLEIESVRGETPLHLATKNGQVETVKWLKEAGVNLAPVDKNGETPLFMAAAINFPELIELLGPEGNPEHFTKNIGLTPKRFGIFSLSGTDEPLLLTPLHSAALKGNLEALQALVMKCEAKLMTRSNFGWTVLHFASHGGHLKVVQWLIDDGRVPPDITSGGDAAITPFALALKEGHTEIAALLKKRGACHGDIRMSIYGLSFANVPNWFKAIDDKKTNELEQHLSNGLIAVNQEGHRIQPLHVAVSGGQYKCTELLIKKGAKLSARLGNGPYAPTALTLAVIKEHPEIIRLLTNWDSRPEDVESTAEDVEFTEFPLIVYVKPTESPLIVLAVGKKNCEDTNALGIQCFNWWYRPFAQAVNSIESMEKGYRSADSEDTRETVKALLAGGSSLEQKLKNRWTPLHLVTMRGDIQFAKFLLDLDEGAAKTETRDHLGRTALHLAAQKGSIPLMALLLERGADMEAPEGFGNTPLHLTANEGTMEILQWLLEHGANPNAQNVHGETPLVLAAKSEINNQKNKQRKIAALLNSGALLGIKDRTGRNGLSYIFESLSAAEAENMIHQFSDQVTLELLNDKDKSGYYPKEWISIFSRSFKNFVTGLTDPDFHDAQVRAAERENNRQRIELLRQPRFK